MPLLITLVSPLIDLHSEGAFWKPWQIASNTLSGVKNPLKVILLITSEGKK